MSDWFYFIIAGEAAAIFGSLLGFVPGVMLVFAMIALFWLTAPDRPVTEEEVQHILHDEDYDGPQS